jgi:hypothetical protein
MEVTLPAPVSPINAVSTPGRKQPLTSCRQHQTSRITNSVLCCKPG